MKHKVRHIYFVGIGGMPASRERVPAAAKAAGGDRPRAGSGAAFLLRHKVVR